MSAGCDHCYAMGVAHRGMSPQHRGLTKLRPRDASRPGVDWTGEVRTVPTLLAKPLSWRKPRRVFVNSMSDLFHHGVPFEFIAAVFGVMAATPRHTYQVLTKRPDRAREFFAWASKTWPMPGPEHTALMRDCLRMATGWPGGPVDPDLWPLRNVHLGVSVEDQATADERIPVLLQLPAAVRWVSYEPALGPVDFANVVDAGVMIDALRSGLGWVVVGGESGHGARPFDLAWARRTVEDCRSAGVPVFVKQLGARPVVESDDVPIEIVIADRKGTNWDEWPADLRVRQFPEPAA